jgi:hypothetical protein
MKKEQYDGRAHHPGDEDVSGVAEQPAARQPDGEDTAGQLDPDPHQIFGRHGVDLERKIQAQVQGVGQFAVEHAVIGRRGLLGQEAAVLEADLEL